MGISRGIYHFQTSVLVADNLGNTLLHPLLNHLNHFSTIAINRGNISTTCSGPRPNGKQPGIVCPWQSVHNPQTADIRDMIPPITVWNPAYLYLYMYIYIYTYANGMWAIQQPPYPYHNHVLSQRVSQQQSTTDASGSRPAVSDVERKSRSHVVLSTSWDSKSWDSTLHTDYHQE